MLINGKVVSRSLDVSSSQLLFNFTIPQLTGFGIHILSVFNDKLLVGTSHHSYLFIYSCNGLLFSNNIINETNSLCDATWTPHGNIIYTIFDNDIVVVMSVSGEVITTYTQITNPRYLSVSNDDIVYLTASETNVYQSADDGVSWSFFLIQLMDGIAKK